MIKLSIITVVYNACENLKLTIDSICGQRSQEFEYIVVDGGSTDGTVELIKNCKRIDKYISEADRGIYDAMNKGISLAEGEIILFLNAGDKFYDENITLKVLKQLENNSFDIAYGDVVLNDKKKLLKKQPEKLEDNYLLTNNICHQSMFFNKRIFEKIGFFDIEEKIFADYKLLLKAYNLGRKFRHFNIIICEYDNINGVSSKLNKIESFKKRAEIVNEVCGKGKLAKYFILNFISKPIKYGKFYFGRNEINM